MKNSKHKCREVVREFVTINVQRFTKRTFTLNDIFRAGKPEFRCITTTHCDKVRTERKKK